MSSSILDAGVGAGAGVGIMWGLEVRDRRRDWLGLDRRSSRLMSSKVKIVEFCSTDNTDDEDDGVLVLEILGTEGGSFGDGDIHDLEEIIN